MATAVIDWTSDETHLFLNPRMPLSDVDQIQKKLTAFDLSSHLWLATSGTGGRFKCVALSKQAFLDSAKAVNTFLNISADDVWINALPNFHVGGLGIEARAHLSGSRVYPITKWDPQLFSKLTFEHSATISALVPTQLFDLVQSNLQPSSGYRLTIIGGGALNRELFDRSWRLGWNAVPSYGMTECASQIATAKPGTFEPFLPLEHVTVKVDDDQRISIKSPSLLTGHCYPHEKDCQFIDPKINGWFRTEDEGDIADAVLKIYGRCHDMFKVNGELVNLQHLQNIINTMTLQYNVDQDAVLSAVPSSRSGHEIHLFHVGKLENLRNLIDNFNQAVLPYERIVSTHHIDKIPRTPLGKVVHSKL